MNIFRSNILNVYGERGKEWLNELPQLVNDIAAKLTLTELKPVDNLSFNYVASGFQGKRPVILKAALDTDALKKEALALWCFEDYGAVKVIAEENGFLLLERAIPGISLKSHLPDQTTNSVAIACKMMQRLHQAPIPAEHNFPHIKRVLTN
jgi:streptomycin 6-kinase